MCMWTVIATWDFSLQGVEQAAKMLEDNQSSLDAIIKVATIVEDDENVTTVGYGGFPNLNGDVELDAAVMRGDTHAFGAVAAVKGYKNPILIAKDVMEKTPHAFLVGSGAEDFAKKQGHVQSSLLTAKSQKEWLEMKQKLLEEPIGHDTVGIVALDKLSKMSAGTSTSGIGMKLQSRVGDSPIIGSGYYVDDAFGGAAATGLGEDIMKGCLCFYAVMLMADGHSPQKAAELAIEKTHLMIAKNGKNPGNMAVICASPVGEYGAAANHEGFAYAIATPNQPPILLTVTPLVIRESSNTVLEIYNNISVQ